MSAYLSLMILLLASTPAALGQGADVFSSGGSAQEMEADEGLQSATPSDNPNELNQGELADDALDNAGGEGPEFGSGFDNDSGNDLFSDDEAAAAQQGAPANASQSAPSAFGVGSSNATASPPATAPVAPVPTVNATVTPPAAVPPANAQVLMNQIATPPVATPPVAPPPVDSSSSVPATGEETLTVDQPPAIEAPPLPPPNEFAGAPPVPGTMRLMADGEAPEEYRVDPGDTLFDICDQLLDEPAYWPKLWSLNPEIKNPHFIFPGMRLRFYPGDDDTPPYLQVVTEDDVIPIDKGELDEQLLVAEKVNFSVDVPTAEEEPPIEVIGPEDIGAEDITDEILTAGTVPLANEFMVQVPGFLYLEEVEPAGVVVGGRSGEVLIGHDEPALVEPESGVSVGTLYTVLRPSEEVENPESGDFVGYKYYYVGNIRIDRGIEDDLYVATLSDARLGAREGDILVPYVSTRRTVPVDTSVGSLTPTEANVVAFEYEDKAFNGFEGYAFIDKGAKDGVSQGMYVGIYGTPGYLTSAFGDTTLPEDYQMVGVIRIIDATDAGAVGFIVKSTGEIRVGDRAGKG